MYVYIFNFNIDIAAPECIAIDVPYAWKFWGTEIMPVVTLGFCIVAYILSRYCAYAVCRDFCNFRRKPDWKSFISTYLILVYFLYLMVVRRALEIFTCNPLTLQSDGFLYATFTSPEYVMQPINTHTHSHTHLFFLTNSYIYI